jgi:uracil-DNA glycosylase family 4
MNPFWSNYRDKADALIQEIKGSECRLCEYSVTRNAIIPPVRDRRTQKEFPVMIIMSCPTDLDDNLGRLNTSSPRNEMLKDWLSKSDLNSVYVTHAVKCVPFEHEESPNKECMTQCVQKWLKKEIVAINPRVVVVMSAEILDLMIPHATTYFRQRGMDTFSEYVGTFINMKDRLVMPIPSPNYIIASGNYPFQEQIIEALKEAKAVTDILGNPFSIIAKES